MVNDQKHEDKMEPFSRESMSKYKPKKENTCKMLFRSRSYLQYEELMLLNHDNNLEEISERETILKI